MSGNIRRVTILGRWIHNQRSRYNINKLSQERINLLEQLPNWTWEDGRWLEKYNEVKEYYQKYQKYPTQDNEEYKSLGIWRNNQKRNYKQDKLTDEQISLLEQLPNWQWSK